MSAATPWRWMRFNCLVSIDWGFATVGALIVAVGCVGYRLAEPMSRLARKQYKRVHAPPKLVEAQTPSLMRLIAIGMLVIGLVTLVVGVV
jgi:hypothetical protein